MKNALKIKKRIRAKIKGTKEAPRLSVYRSNTSISAQLIDDARGITIFGMTQRHVKDLKGNKSEKAKAFGVALAKQALEKKIKKVIFDRGGYRYHGRVKALAEGAREGGLVF